MASVLPASGPNWQTTLAASTALIAAGVGTAAFLAVRRRSQNEVPGPAWVLPGIGETLEFMKNPPQFMWDRARQYKSLIFRVHIFGSEVIIVGDAKLARTILGDDELADPDVPVDTFVQLLGDQKYRSGTENHRMFRKHLQAAAMPQNLKKHFPSFLSVVERKVQEWIAQCQTSSKGTVDLQLEGRYCVSELGLGPVNGLPLSQSFVELFCEYSAGAFCAPIYLPGTQWYKALKAKPKVWETLEKKISERFPPVSPGGPLRLDRDQGGYTEGSLDFTKAAFVEMQEAGAEVTPAMLTHRVVQNVFGSTETTGSSVFTMLAITAAQPEVQRRLREEQAAVMRQSGPTLTAEQLHSQMPYLDAVVRETLRLFPTAHGGWRRMKKPVELGGYQMPAGSLLMWNTEMQSLCEWADPLSPTASKELPADFDFLNWQQAWNPDRWLDKSGNAPNLHLFAAGSFSCLGREVSIMEQKLILAVMARQCTWRIVSTDSPRFHMIPWVTLANGKPDFKLTPNPITV